MDYQALLFNPIYSIQGVPATLTLSSRTIEGLTVLDKTAGIDVGDNVAVQTIRPAAIVRMRELQAKSVALSEIERATLSFNGGQWRVSSFRKKPSPYGEDDGELYLILSGRVSISESESESA